MCFSTYIDARTIAEECQFHLDINDNTEEEEQEQEQQSTSKKRLSTKSFAITSWTNVSSKSI